MEQRLQLTAADSNHPMGILIRKMFLKWKLRSLNNIKLENGHINVTKVKNKQHEVTYNQQLFSNKQSASTRASTAAKVNVDSLSIHNDLHCFFLKKISAILSP